MEKDTLALEMFKELKTNAKRWFIVSVILMIALVGSNVAWLIYESQYETVTEEESITQEQTETDNSNMSGVIN